MGRLSGVVVKFVCSASAAWGLQVHIPGVDLHTAQGGVPYVKQRKTVTDVSPGTLFLKQKGEDWQQILAQSQSSSPKKNKLLWNISKWFLFPFPYQKHKVIFFSDLYYGNLIEFLEIHFTILCPPISWLGLPGVFNSQACPHWDSLDSLVCLFSLRGSGFACALSSLMDPRRFVDFSVCSAFICFLGGVATSNPSRVEMETGSLLIIFSNWFLHLFCWV